MKDEQIKKKKKSDPRILIFILPVAFALICWIVGYVYGRHERIIGKFQFKTRPDPVVFVIPKYEELFLMDSIATYQEGRVYDVTKKINFSEFKKIKESVKGKTLLVNFGLNWTKETIRLHEIEGIIAASDLLQKKELKRMVSSFKVPVFFEKIVLAINRTLPWIIGFGYLTLLSMLFTRSGKLLFVWWWCYSWFFTAQVGLYAVVWLTGNPLKDIFWIGPVLNRYTVTFRILGENAQVWKFLSSVLVFIICPILFVMMGMVFLTKHVLPKRKREIEDFVKYDKDKDKRSELSIENVTFKDVKFDLRKKLKRYQNRNEFFLGVGDDKKDITIPTALMSHHVHIMGPSGTGKTSMTFLPLALQTLDKGYGGCFIDFKGDDILKKTICEKTKEKGKKFYYFTIDPNEASVFYNPLLSGDKHSKVDRIMSALELIYDGPAGFYSNVQTMTFISLLKEMEEEGREVSFKSIQEGLKDASFLRSINVEEKDVKGLFAALSKLSDYSTLNGDGINLKEIINNGDVIFFALKSQINTQIAEAIGRMLIIDLKYHAASRKEIDKQFYIFIDEFQTIASNHFVDVISKVRSANFCLVLSNQTRGNLLAVDKSFENTVFTNTATKVVFNQEDPKDAQFWAEKTGKTLFEQRSMRTFSGKTFGDDSTVLDGKRELEGSIQHLSKNYISENIFLRLPLGKSVIFLRQKNAKVSNHQHYYTLKERDALLNKPFINERGIRNWNCTSKEERELVKKRKKRRSQSEKKGTYSSNEWI